jgi:hypothetical protein
VDATIMKVERAALALQWIFSNDIDRIRP